MRLSFRLVGVLGAFLFSSIKLALASEGFSENFPVSQAPGLSVVFEHLTIEDGLSQNAGLGLA